jgi:hypothetical protein
MLRTKQDVKMTFGVYGEIIIPKGTRITNMTALGLDPKYNFVEDLSWIPTHYNGIKQYGLIHDATFYGINVPAEFVEDAEEKQKRMI